MTRRIGYLATAEQIVRFGGDPTVYRYRITYDTTDGRDEVVRTELVDYLDYDVSDAPETAVTAWGYESAPTRWVEDEEVPGRFIASWS